MKKIAILPALVMALILTAFSASAQSPVKWTASAKMTSRTEGVITVTATIDAGWHIYGLDATDDGPVPTSIEITPTKGVALKGALASKPAPVAQMDDMFGCEVKYWENKVTFTRKFRVAKSVKSAAATVKVSYMCCNDSSCRPPQTEEIKVKIK